MHEDNVCEQTASALEGPIIPQFIMSALQLTIADLTDLHYHVTNTTFFLVRILIFLIFFIVIDLG
jgi:hypothetical protein